MKHEEARSSLLRFLSRDAGDSGTLTTPEGQIEFEVIRKETVPTTGSQSMTRLVCVNVDTDERFNIDSVRVRTMNIIWD